MKIKIKKDKGELQIRVKFSFGEKVNEAELQLLTNNNINGVLEPKRVKRKTFDYTGTMGITLEERLKKMVTKEEFFYMMEHVLLLIRKIQANNLDISKILFEPQNIFINEATKVMNFVYIPILKEDEKKDMFKIFENIYCNVQRAEENDMEYIERFNNFLMSLRNFDLDEIENFIAKEVQVVVRNVRRINMGQKGCHLKVRMECEKKERQAVYLEKEFTGPPTDLMETLDTMQMEENLSTDYMFLNEDTMPETGMMDNEDNLSKIGFTDGEDTVWWGFMEEDMPPTGRWEEE